MGSELTKGPFGQAFVTWCVPHCVQYLADEIHELRKREKEQGLEPDWEIDHFMKASAARGKRHSIMTDYVMRMLGLEVCHSSLSCMLRRWIFPNRGVVLKLVEGPSLMTLKVGIVQGCRDR